MILTRQICLAVIFGLVTTVMSEVIFNHNTNENERWCRGRTPCIRKCCAEHQVLKNKKCTNTSSREFTFKSYDGLQEIINGTVRYNVIHTNSCKTQDRLKLSPDLDEADIFYVQRNGTLSKPNDDVMPRISYQFYCLETFVFSDRDEFSAMVCYGDGDLEATSDKQNACTGMKNINISKNITNITNI